jgi:serine/threonine protein kinase/Tol biopolymer transport system component
MPLSAGDKLGPYEILAQIGAGGMGEVYRARDTTLKREVALKVLPAAFLRDPERMARFQREAEVLASLDHPNIGHIYGIVDSEDSRGLVLALIEGPTLADRIAAGAMPPEEALHVAKQIIEALEYAHDRGVVHRDLKPANVKITPAGVVKVLDFGLAKVLEDEPPASSVANSPTLTLGHTRAGVILGTAAYMSPEQAVGRTVDRRSDIFSFGAVLYEMLTGLRAFAGAATPDVLEAVVKNDPDWSMLPATTPGAIRQLLRRCLAKDRKQRLQAIGEARITLEKGESEGRQPAQANGLPNKQSNVAWMVAAIGIAAALVVSFVHFREQPPAAELMRFQIPPPEKAILGNSLSLSPDGRRLAFTARGADGIAQIWVRSLDTLAVHPLPGTERVGNSDVFWSPDSRFIGFAVPGQLKKVEASGGPAQTVCDLPNTFRGGAWAPDGTIIFGAFYRPLMRVPETGGVPAPLTALTDQEASHGHPSFLPDGRHFVYERSSAGNENGGIYLGSLDAKPEMQDSKRMATSLAPSYAPSPDPGFGYVLFGREGSLMALPFDARRLEPAGAAVPVAEGLPTTGALSYSASATGVLAFRTGPPGGTDSQLLWFDRQGKQLGQIGPPAPYGNLQLSPDGKLLLVDRRNQHLWVADLARGVFSRVNPGNNTDYGIAVSPDGRVAFTYTLAGALGDIYVKLASGAGVAEPLVKSATQKHPNNWSLDGRFLIYDDHTSQRQDLWIVPMSGEKTGDRKPIPFLVTPADETFGQFSPDTKWVAYSSDESGGWEVYVQGFVPDHVPAAGVGKWHISTAGGDKPRWRRDGKELYYIALDGKMMAVPVKSTATTFEPGAAVPLFETHATGFTPYDVAADGRFLINTVMEEAAAKTSPITVVLNWTAELKK